MDSASDKSFTDLKGLHVSYLRECNVSFSISEISLRIVLDEGIIAKVGNDGEIVAACYDFVKQSRKTQELQASTRLRNIKFNDINESRCLSVKSFKK